MDKKKPNNNKVNEKKPKLKPKGYINDFVKPRMGADGYLHCAYCRRRYEPGHRCDKQYK